MATAYSTLLGLALPVTGELSGTWGDTVNNSITSLLDSAIAGTTTLSADTTLTTTTGASNQARQAILLCTGHVANITITAPAQSKIYTVINASATYTAKIRGVGPTTGITIPVSSTATVAWNGSDFVDASGYINGNLKVNGTLSVTGVATFAAGSAALPAITTTGDTNTGMWFPAADTIAFTEGGVESMRIDSSGNLGLGVTPSGWSTSAQKALQVYLSGVSSNGGGNTASRFTHGCYLDGSTWKYQDTGVAPTRYEVTGANAGSTHSWSVAAGGTADAPISFTQAMTLDASGNLSIGATSTTGRLLAAGAGFNILGNAYGVASFLQDTTTARGVFMGYDSTGQIGTVSASSNGAASNLAFWTYSGSAWAEKMRIDSSGNLVVGKTSTVSKFEVNSGTNLGGLLIGFNGTSANFYDADSHYWRTGNGTGRASMDSSGNLGLGVTPAASIRLYVQATSASSSDWIILGNDSAGNNLFGFRADGNLYAANIPSSTGTALVLTSGGYINKLTSSIRYKKDVLPIDIGLDFILGLKPVKYNLKDSDEAQVGFIAEDFPDTRLVAMSRIDKDDESKGLQPESVNYSQIVAPLVKAIQEQQALITQLTARITALEGA